MTSKVYAMDLRASLQENLYVKLDRLLDAVGLEEIIKQRHLVAIKLHFGEKGNTAYIPPTHLRHLVNRVKNLAGKPFLTDTNTLYVGTRTNSADHLTTAIENGFGKVRVADSLWRVKGADAPVGSRVRVTAADGVILVVEPAD